MPQVIDMHMHLGFAADARSLAMELQNADIAAFSCTVTPQEYEHLRKLELDSLDGIALGIGQHPWYIDGREQLAAFTDRIASCRLVGEIGLDFSPAHDTSRQEQICVFQQILDVCAKGDGKLISIHAVKTKGELLDALEQSGAIRNCTCLLHSYAGSSDELKRAIDAGCYFSVGQRMLASKRGREYARIIPEPQVLLETDLPARVQTSIGAQDYIDSLEITLLQLAKLRSCNAEQLANHIRAHSKSLIEKYTI